MSPLQKLRLMVARGILNLVNDAGGLQVVQVSLLEGETRDDVERIQNFGLSGNPPAGSVPVAVSVGGSRDHMIVIACDHESIRPKGLKSGESAMYAAFGQLLKMDSAGNVTLTCQKFTVNAASGFKVNAPKSDFSGALQAQTIDGGVSLETHTHPEHDGGNTGVPNT